MRLRLQALGLVLALPLLFAGSSERKAAKPKYRFQIPSSMSLVEGQAQDLVMAIVPNRGFRVDGHGPLQIGLRPSSGDITVKKQRLTRRDASDKASEAPRFQVSVRGKSAGLATLEIGYRFWLCRAKICWPIHGQTSLQVKVQAPPSPVGEIGDAGTGDAASQ